MKTEEKGITLGQLCNIMFGKWWLLCIVLVVVFVAGMLFINLDYNKQKTVYSSRFEYSLSNLVNGIYNDGTTFDYKVLQSLSVLEEVKASSENFESIDVKKMHEEGGIVVNFVEPLAVESSTQVENPYFTISVNAKYFKNASQASQFVNALALVPIQKNIETINFAAYNANLRAFTLSKIYESQVEYLQNQLALLDGEYDDLIKENGDVVTENGRRISEIKAELDLYFNNNTFDYLYSEITINGYVKDESYLTQLTLEKESLTKQQNLCQEQIDALREERDNLITSAGSLQTLDLESYNSQIVLLTNKKIEIAKQIDEIQTKIDGIGQDVSTFEATLQEYYNKLVEFTNEFCDTASYVVSSDASVRYTTGQIIAANGGMGRLSSTILCLLAGLVLGCCVNMIVDRKKFKEYSTGDKN